MIEKVKYIHNTARFTNSVDVEIWAKDGKLFYNKKNMPIRPDNSNYAIDAESSLSIEEFEKKLASLKIEEWEDICTPTKDEWVLDGSDWSVKVKYEGRKAIKKEGQNAYPDNWNKFIMLLKQIAGEFDTITF